MAEVRRRQSITIEEENIFQMVIDELLEEILWDPKFENAEAAHEWLTKVVEYNVPNGKQIRGRGIVTAYRSINPNPSKAELKKTYAVGWAIETLGACFHIPEDIMRQSQKRRGKTCWHLVEGVGKTAVNDAFLLNGIVYYILDRYFVKEPYYRSLVKVFNECFFRSTLGQSLDSKISSDRGKSMSVFNMENYRRVCKYKFSHPFFIPMAAAKIMIGNCSSRDIKSMEETATLLGHLFQVQNDYLDIFGDPDVTGKVGTSIAENKITWFVVQALDKATLRQKLILKDNYGRGSNENISRIIDLFHEMKLLEEYRNYELKCYTDLVENIKKLPPSVPQLFFQETADLLFTREK